MIRIVRNNLLVILFSMTQMFSLKLLAQTIEKSLISTSGEVYNHPSIQLQWTIGELSISQLSNNGIRLTEGFHAEIQNSDLSTAINDLHKVKSIAVSPNPTLDIVRIPSDVKLQEGSSIHLYSNHGIFINSMTALDRNQVDMSSIPKGMYYLIIIQPDRTGTISKILKM